MAVDLSQYPEFLTVKDVAKITNKKERTIRYLCKKGVIGASQLGKSWRIPKESLDEYIKIRR